MAISIMGVRKERQYGKGEVWNIKDLSSFGWVVVVREEDDGRGGQKEVIVRRPAYIGEDALVNKMESIYEAEYQRIENDIIREFSIRQLLAVLLGIPSIFMSILYLLSGTFENILPITSSIDRGVKNAFSFMGEQAAGAFALSIRFIFLVLAVLCIIFFVVNIVSYYKRKNNPLKYYKRTAKRIEEAMIIAQQRVECIKSKDKQAKTAEKENKNEISPFSGDFANGSYSEKQFYCPRRKLMPYFESFRMPSDILYDGTALDTTCGAMPPTLQ